MRKYISHPLNSTFEFINKLRGILKKIFTIKRVTNVLLSSFQMLLNQVNFLSLMVMNVISVI